VVTASVCYKLKNGRWCLMDPKKEFEDWVALLKRTGNEDMLNDPYNIWLEAWSLAQMKKDPTEVGSKHSP